MSLPNSLEEVSKHFSTHQMPKRIRGPLSLREALGLTQNAMGLALGHYTGKGSYTRSTVSTWERVERGLPLAERYAMTEKGREAYRQLLADLVEEVSEGRYRLVAEMGK